MEGLSDCRPPHAATTTTLPIEHGDRPSPNRNPFVLQRDLEMGQRKNKSTLALLDRFTGEAHTSSAEERHGGSGCDVSALHPALLIPPPPSGSSPPRLWKARHYRGR